MGEWILTKTGERRWKPDSLEVGRPQDELLGKHRKHTHKVHQLENWMKITLGFKQSHSLSFPLDRSTRYNEPPGAPVAIRYRRPVAGRQSSRPGSEDRGRRGRRELGDSSHQPEVSSALKRRPRERNLTKHHNGPAERPDVGGTSPTSAGKTPADPAPSRRPGCSAVLHYLTLFYTG